MNTESSINPLTFGVYSPKYYSFNKIIASKNMPINMPENVKKLTDLVAANHLVIVKASTGSGKTIALPIHILKMFRYGVKIAMTQPRTLITIKNAETIAAQLDVKLGTQVIYKYKDSDIAEETTEEKRHAPKTIPAITVMTDGTLLREFIENPAKYNVIIIDEFHERNPNIDMLLLLIKKYLTFKINEKIETKLIPKVLLLSATIDEAKYVRYFSSELPYNVAKLPIKVGVMSLGGAKTYPREEYFLDEAIGSHLTMIPAMNGVDGQPDKIIDFLLNFRSGDILVFLPTIDKVLEYQGMYATKLIPKLLVGSFFRGQDVSKTAYYGDKELFLKDGYNRRLLFATNIAQVGLTIDGLIHVVDTGTKIKKFYDTDKCIVEFSLEKIGKADAQQRFGRVGRTQAGFSYAIYTRDEYSKFVDYDEPEIYNIDIRMEILRYAVILKSLNKSCEYFKQLVDPIRTDSINAAKRQILENELFIGDSVQETAKFIALMEIDFDLGLLLLNSFKYKLHRHVIAIIAMMMASRSPKKFFVVPKDDKTAMSAHYKKFANNYGEHKVLYEIYRDFLINYKKLFDIKNEKLFNEWTKGRQYNPKMLLFVDKKIIDMEKAINKFIIANKFKIAIREMPTIANKKLKLWDKINVIFRKTYPSNIAILASNKLYQIADLAEDIKLAKGFFGEKMPPVLGYTQIIKTAFGPSLLMQYDYITGEDIKKEKFDK